MTIDQINAMNRFAMTYPRGWKRALSDCWLRAVYPAGISAADKVLLQQLRNSGGPDFIAKFKPRPDGYRKLGFIKKDQMEQLTQKQGRLVSAWRIVTLDGVDLVQPWSTHKAEAVETASELGIFIAGALS